VPPIVSIITPSFNRANIVHETAASIFNQSYPHWEWVIVDDGSTDNSWEILEGFAAKDSRVKIFRRDRDPKGACVCRNIAVEKCKGDYLIFLDTDDLLASFCLEQRVKAMEENPESDFVIFPMLLFKNQPDDLMLLWNIDTEEDDLLRILKGDPVCQGTGTIWKKSSFQNIGMWKEDLRLWQDIELHIRSILWPLRFTKKMDLAPDVFLRISDISLSRTGFHALPKFLSRKEVFLFSCERIRQAGLLAKYTEGLQVMGYDLITSGIKSRYFSETEELIRYCTELQLFSTDQLRQFRKYHWSFRMRLYKIPSLFRVLEERHMRLLPAFSSTINQIKWLSPIQL
jgi:glycosyltransferase involved in cell wall biosynthesis